MSDETFSKDEWAQIGQAIARLRASVMAVVFGLLSGVGLFIATIWLVVTAKDGYPVGPTLSLLNNYFPGYSVTYGGAFLGLIYGAILGGITGYLLAYIYNAVVEARMPKGG